jgi:HK97 family phage major capsid protein
MRVINTDVLEADYRKKRDAAVSLYRQTITACDAHEEKDAEGKVTGKGRPMTGDEATAIQRLMDDASAIKSRLAEAASGNTLATEIDKLTAGMTAADRAETKAAALKSLGQQWVEGDGGNYFFKKQHHGTRNWSSPTQELTEPDYRRMATTLTTQAGSGGSLLVPQYLPGILPILFRPLKVRDLLASGTTDSPLIVYMVETTFTNAAAAVSEGAAKPESALVFSQVQEAVTKLAHWLPVTEEMLEDVSQIRDYIDARLIVGLDLVEEDQLLNGNGTAPNLKGLLARTGVQTLAVGAAPDTAIDAIYRAITQVYTSSWVMPTGIVMNPANWSKIATVKDTLGRYLGSGPWAPSQTPTLWGLPIAVTPAIVAGTCLIGAFGSQAQVFARGGTRVEASNSHQDFFIKNLVAIRAERRLALAVYRPSSFITVTALP